MKVMFASGRIKRGEMSLFVRRSVIAASAYTGPLDKVALDSGGHRIQCAWSCKRVLVVGGFVTSHTICKECERDLDERNAGSELGPVALVEKLARRSV